MKAQRDVPRVTLIWPGGMFEPGGTFGVPQLLSMARCVSRRTSADVAVYDLDQEVMLGPVDLVALCRGADVVGISCYSSFDYLCSMAMARALRRAYPKLVLATGGYHASARPGDFTRADSPFDYVVIGDGEMPLARLVESLARGQRPLQRTLGPEALPSPEECLPYDWSLLDRYARTAHTRASQMEIYLSRGCPYDCSFCMGRAKRETSWRALPPDAAVEELHRADAHVDLSRWTLRIVDPLFGMKRAWRREFLEQLDLEQVRRIRKTGLLRAADDSWANAVFHVSSRSWRRGCPSFPFS